MKHRVSTRPECIRVEHSLQCILLLYNSYTSDESMAYIAKKGKEKSHLCKYFTCINLMFVHIKHIKRCQIVSFQVKIQRQICLFRLRLTNSFDKTFHKCIQMHTKPASHWSMQYIFQEKTYEILHNW